MRLVIATIFSQRNKSIFIFLLSLALFFLGFYRNQWQAVRQKKFNIFQYDVESYIAARMVISRQDGIFSYGGLLGWGDVDIDNIKEDDDYEHQFDTYLNGKTFTTYSPKLSNPGFQGVFFSVLDLAIPLPPEKKLKLFRALMAGLLALTLSGIVLWFYVEFGLLSALLVLISSLISQWMTVFGPRLFFFSWIFYLPIAVLLYLFCSETNEKAISNKKLFWIIFSLALIKSLFNGYDFILPVLGMIASPIIFYAALRYWERRKFFQRFSIAVLASVAAVFSSLVVLAFQNSMALGNMQNGVEFIVQTIFRRTYDFSSLSQGPSIVDSISVWEILKIYLDASYLWKLSLPYSKLILFFAILSCVYLFLKALLCKEQLYRTKGFALVIMTWFSLLSPLAWYIIFKKLAYFHTHMNYLPWHMPFTLFGFGLSGFIVQDLFEITIKKFTLSM